MISYEMHCYGHARRFVSAGGAVSTSLSFCSGCRQRPVSKGFKKNSGSCELGSKLGRGVNSYASAPASSSLFPTSARAAALTSATLGNVK